MSQLASSLLQAADQNKELLTILAATDYAPSSLTQNGSYISDLKSQIASTDKQLARLHLTTEDERKDHIKYRDSNVKRWAYKLQGQKGKDKFVSKQEKEEREFLDAWQKERSTKENRDELARALEQAEKDRPQLEADSKRQQAAQQELDTLYQSLFSGPTPEVPGEDDLEQAVQQAKSHADETQSHLRNETLARDTLRQAETCLQTASVEMDSALRRSTRDMWGGGTFTDMMEREALSQAQNAIHATTRHMATAMRYQPAIRPLTEISIDQGHLFSDVMFDNIFSDLAQHERIEASQGQLVEAIRGFVAQVREQEGRVKEAERLVGEGGLALEGRRRQLQNLRAEAFERFVLAGGAPPGY